MQKIIVFGGTFNPIHFGHIHLYRHFAKLVNADKAIIIPDYLPPHKAAKELASAEDRMEMCRLAVSDDKTAVVSDMELLRGGESYTAVTLEQLARQNQNALLYFVIGSDMLFTLSQWREPQKIVNLATICAAARHLNELEALQKKACELKKIYGGEFIIDNIDVLDISSTQLRLMIKEGKNLDKYLPSAVIKYIKMNGLYKNEI
ncbi:MAG: nicotinate (nicotinamide) nucleotide adenylyltransferase [Hydrogenoanaerobacterium sp.]